MVVFGIDTAVSLGRKCRILLGPQLYPHLVGTHSLRVILTFLLHPHLDVLGRDFLGYFAHLFQVGLERFFFLQAFLRLLVATLLFLVLASCGTVSSEQEN
mmetsp:Transcript_33282/g.32358  ORF Transcript_33282/g.32358 Transcript_33282/m.32358 type:complete len:100 (+) Transcript_33282:599-898(+)